MSNDLATVDLATKAGQVTAAVQAVQTENEALRLKLAEATTAIEGRNARIEQLERGMNERMSMHELDLAQAHSRIATLENERDELRAEKVVLEIKLASQCQRARQMADELEQMALPIPPAMQPKRKRKENGSHKEEVHVQVG